MQTPKKNKIYFTGFMGSGKSTLAPLIANVLGYDHADIDHLIEQRTGTTVAELFATRGEPFFRNLEHEILIELSHRSNLVVALGGGTIVFGNNLQIMKETGLLVYLKASPEAIVRRVKRKQNRPLLKDEDGTMLTEEALRNRVYDLLALREPFYQQSDIIIEVGNAAVAYTVDRVARLIRDRIEQ